MKKFLKRLFCKHDYIFYYNIYGDEILLTGKRSVSKCVKCKKLKWYDKLQTEECKMGQLSEGLEKMKTVGVPVGSYIGTDQGVDIPVKPIAYSEEKPKNVKRFEMLGAEKALLYARKNADYGDSFNKSLDEDGLLVAKIRMMDKISRFAQLIKNPAQVTEEKLRETLIDLSNYADMTIMWLDETDQKEPCTKHHDELDAMAHALVAAGADWDGDIVHGQYMNLKEGVIKPIHGTENTYNIHVHAEAGMDVEKVAETLMDQIKRIEFRV